MDLLTLLASAIHDAKNQLHAMAVELDQLAASNDPVVVQAGERLRQRCRQLDQRLVALLGIYRLQQDKLLTVREGYVADLLKLAAAPWPQVEIECSGILTGFFDESLMRAVISDALDNAVRHAASRVLLRARPEGNSVLITIEDDGPGFAAQDDNNAAEGTGLGLYFAEQVLRAHRNKVTTGSVEKGRSAELGGAQLRLLVP